MERIKVTWVSFKDLSARWGVGRDAVRRRLDGLSIEVVKVGRENYVRAEDVERWEVENGVPGFGRPRPLIDVLAEEDE